MKKKFWPDFSRIFELDKPQGTVFKGPETSLTITLKVIRSFLQDLRGCLKQFFEKKVKKFPLRKSFWPIFSLIFEFDKPQGTVFKDPKASLTRTVEDWRFFFRTWEVVENTIFGKRKAIYPVKKKIWRFFSFIRVWQTSGDGFQGFKG